MLAPPGGEPQEGLPPGRYLHLDIIDILISTHLCPQEYDEVVDTTITEHCEEVITTTCQQVSTKSVLSQQV